MKNFLFIIIVFLSLISCGKKGDPEYNENKSEIFNTKIKVVLWSIEKRIFWLKMFLQKNLGITEELARSRIRGLWRTKKYTKIHFYLAQSTPIESAVNGGPKNIFLHNFRLMLTQKITVFCWKYTSCWCSWRSRNAHLAHHKCFCKKWSAWF